MKKRVEQTVKGLKFYLKAKEIGTRDMSGKFSVKLSDKLFVNRVISGGFEKFFEILRAIADWGNLEKGNHEFKIFKLF